MYSSTFSTIYYYLEFRYSTSIYVVHMYSFSTFYIPGKGGFIPNRAGWGGERAGLLKRIV